MSALAGAASAHDALPAGNGTCTAAGTDWPVANGSTHVENTGGADWSMSLATTAGIITATSSTTGTGDTPAGGAAPTYTVTGIPAAAASITVTTTLVWDAAAVVPHAQPNYTGGPSHESTPPISQPAGGCNVLTPVAVPAAPNAAPPTCFGPGSLTRPANTPSVHWAFTAPVYTPGAVGTFVETATAQPGYVFIGGATVKNYSVNLAGKDTSSRCDTVAVPVTPSVRSSQCTGPGTNTTPSLTIPVTTGVVYKIAGNVASGVISEQSGRTVTVVATPTVGYKFTGAQSVSKVLTFGAVDCSVTAMPVVPTFSQLECTGPNTHSTSQLEIPLNVTGVIYKINGKTVSGTIDETGARFVTVTAITAPGYTFAKNAVTTWTEDFTDTGVCMTATKAATPDFTSDQCKAGVPAHSATYTIPSIQHVTYRVNGRYVTAGTHSATTGSTITVTAFASNGYSLGNSTSSWSRTFLTPVCHGLNSVNVHKDQTAGGLANTGVPTAALVVGGILIVLLGVGFLVAGGIGGRKKNA